MLTLKSLSKAEGFVARQNMKGNDVRWDGWTMVFFTPDDNAFYSRNGAFRKGVWGFENRSALNAEGVWEVDRRDVL